MRVKAGRPGEVAMRRGRLLLLAGVMLAVAVGIPAAVQYHARSQRLARGRLIDQAHFGQIEVGMSRSEVEVILGGPPGDFTTRRVYFEPGIALLPSVRSEWWRGDHGEITVRFDEQSRASTLGFGRARMGQPPSLAERVRDWLLPLWP
jgi:hypothetical protein